METGLFILDAIVIVVAVIMSLRDDRAGPEQPSTSYFRYAEAAATAPPPRTWRSRTAPERPELANPGANQRPSQRTSLRPSQATDTRGPAGRDRTGRRPGGRGAPV